MRRSTRSIIAAAVGVSAGFAVLGILWSEPLLAATMCAVSLFAGSIAVFAGRGSAGRTCARSAS